MDYSDNIINVSDLCDRHEELTGERQDLVDSLEEAETALQDAREDLESAEAEAESADECDSEREALRDAEENEKSARDELADWDKSDEASELKMLSELLEELQGYGGDHKWEGNWYPSILIKDDHFQDYAQQLAEELGDMPADSWPHRHIDWEAAACELRQDYSSVTVNGEGYLYRG